MGYENKSLNKYTYVSHYNSITSDGIGGIYMPSIEKPDSIIHFDINYDTKSEINIPELQSQVRKQDFISYSKHQRIFNISVIEDHLFISLSDNTTCITTKDGEIINVLNTYRPNGSGKYESPSNSIRCIYFQLKDQMLLTLAQSKFQGSQIAISDNTHPNYFDNDHIKSRIVSHSYNYPDDYLCPVFNAQKINSAGALTEFLKEIKTKYQENRNPDKEYIHYASEMKIWDLIELDSNHILLFIYTNLSNKADQPNKNMPYFLCKMEKSTGKIVKTVSPEDRSISHLNLFPKFFKNENRILFKTSNSLYHITSELEISKIVDFTERSAFKKFTPIASDEHSIHYIIPDKAELFSHPNEGKIEMNIKTMEKDYRIQKKNKSM